MTSVPSTCRCTDEAELAKIVHEVVGRAGLTAAGIDLIAVGFVTAFVVATHCINVTESLRVRLNRSTGCWRDAALKRR